MRFSSAPVTTLRRSSRSWTRSPRRPASGTSEPMAGARRAPGGSGASVRYAWLARLVGVGMALYLRLVARTCRVVGPATRDQVVLAFWHECNMAAFVTARKLRGDLPHAS